MLWHGSAMALARQLQDNTLTLGPAAFAFMSGLYFRGS
jgi:hypothetical protein